MMPPLIIFDLDGTLASSKEAVTEEMVHTLTRLLAVTKVGIISGGTLTQLKTQVAGQLSSDAQYTNLYLLPTSGAALYEYKEGELKKVYEERLSEKELNEIEVGIRKGAEQTALIDFSKKVYGERIEKRGSQVTLSALGQHAPLEAKLLWDPTRVKKERLRDTIAKLLPAFTVSIGGMTSIDITKKDIDKAYGVHQLCSRLGIRESDALYIGDELKKDGNDAAVYKTDVQTKAVKNPDDTKRLIDELLNDEEDVPSE